MTTQLKGASTVFMPFNQGSAGAGKSGGKGNPLDPKGEKTRYFWHKVLQRDNWLRLIGSYIHIQYLIDENTGKKSGDKILPHLQINKPALAGLVDGYIKNKSELKVLLKQLNIE